MDKYMERQLDDVIHYAKQKAECIIKFKEIQQKLRSIRLEFEKNDTFGVFDKVNLNPIGDKKLRFSI